MNETAAAGTSTASGFERPVFPVVLVGIATTILTMAALFFLNENTDLNIMGWYAKGIFPVGAIFVGLIAASGYGLMSYLTGIKISKGLLVTVLLFQLFAYVVAQVIEYKSVQAAYPGQVPGFFAYYDIVTQAMTFTSRSSHSAGAALGMFGYAFRVLELVGFCAGGLIVPFALRGTPYCESCQRYQKTKQLVYLPASAKTKAALFKGKDQKQAEVEESRGVFSEAQAQIAELDGLIQEGRADVFREKLQAARAGSKAAAGLNQRVSIESVTCPACGAGKMKWVMLTGQGRDIQRTEVGERAVTSDFARSVAQK